jgi:hypothetical protein
MKVFIGAFIFLSLLVSCNDKQEDESAVTEKKEDLVEIKNGIYTEWYPGKKNIKFQGAQDEKAHGFSTRNQVMNYQLLFIQWV